MEIEQSSGSYHDEMDNQENNVRDYFNVIRKRIAIILTIAAVIFTWKVVGVYTTTPIYTASSDVLIEKNAGTSGIDRQYNYYDPFYMTTQSEIIKSQNVARRVVENLQLDKKYKTYFINNKIRERSFFSNIKLKIKQTIKAILPLSDKKDNGEGKEDAQLSNHFPSEQYTAADIIARMIRGGLSVMPIPNSKIVTIAYRNKNPAIAKLVANAVVQAYQDVTLEIKLSNSSYSLQWMTKKAAEERKKLEDAENALQQYMRANDLVTVENRLALIPQKLSQVSSEFTKAQTERKELEEVYQQITNATRETSALENIPIFATNDVLQKIREQIFKAKQNIKDLSKKYGHKHPVMIKANDELGILKSEINFEIKRIVASTKNSLELAISRETNLEVRLTATKAELLNVNEKFVQFSIMKREVDTNRVLYDALTSNIKRTGVTEQAQSANIWVVRKATLPGAPSHPDKKKALTLGLALGIGLGIAIAFVLEYLDNTIKSEKDLTGKFDLTILGTVEQVKGAGTEVESMIVNQPLSPLAESYRLVRSNLLLSAAEHPPKTILVTSMGPREGKTSTTINLARVLSQGDKKVLIIDCDLRKPRMHTLFGMDNKAGLSNFLTGTMDGNILYDVPGEGIKLIPSGLIPPNPAELLSSRKMKMLVDKMADMFDFVLLDSPPIQRVTDSLAVSQIVEGAIVVVRARLTTYDMLTSGMKKLRDVNAPFIGFVLNGMHRSEAGSGYYAGYNTYYAKDPV